MTVGVVGCNRIPDNSMIQNFTTNEAAFVQLRDLFASDSQLTTIRRNLIMSSGVVLRSPPLDIEGVGLSQERYSAYVQLLDRLGLEVGVARSGSGIWFEAQGPSFANGAARKGYIYSDLELAPLVADLDARVPSNLRRPGEVLFRRLNEHWYLWLGYD